jgi:hypothetical protein
MYKTAHRGKRRRNYPGEPAIMEKKKPRYLSCSRHTGQLLLGGHLSLGIKYHGVKKTSTLFEGI